MRRIERMRSALVYEYPIDRLIALAKFASRVECAHALGELLAAYLVSCRLDADVPDAITPVPLHRRRLAARGFNQALEIARPVAAGLGVPLLQDRCVRERNTPEQTSLAGRARFVNIAGAFRATGDFAGRHIAILDDVITTGSTAQSMATTLSRAGAARIQIWSVARAVRSAYSNV